MCLSSGASSGVRSVPARTVARIVRRGAPPRGLSHVRRTSASSSHDTAPLDGEDDRPGFYQPGAEPAGRWRVAKLTFRMPDWSGDGDPVIVGAGDAMGDWDPELGLELRGCVRDPSGDPDLWCGFCKLPAGATGEYKVVVRRDDAVDQWMPDEGEIPTDEGWTVDATARDVLDATARDILDAIAAVSLTSSGAPVGCRRRHPPVRDRQARARSRRRHRRSRRARRLPRRRLPGRPGQPRPDPARQRERGPPSRRRRRPRHRRVPRHRAPRTRRTPRRRRRTPALGYWKPESGAKMTWSEGDAWTTAVKFDAFSIFGALDASSPAAWLDFKLVRVDERTGAARWLDGDDYRVRRVDAADASALINRWLSGEHCVADLGVAAPDGEFAEMESPEGTKEWVDRVSVEIVGAGAALAVVGDVKPAFAPTKRRVPSPSWVPSPRRRSR